jgi:streptogramin lyase
MQRVLIIFAVLALLAPATARAQRIEPVPGLASAADAIAAGPDGALWATLPADPGRVARITTAGAVTHVVTGGLGGFPANRRPAALAPHAGAVWFTLDGGPDTFARLVPGGAVTPFALTYGRPTALTSGPDGALWMTVDGPVDAIVRWTPVEWYTVLGPGVDPRPIVAGPDGALWFAEDGRIGRITTGGAVSYRPVTGRPTALASGPGGALWYAQGSTVRRLDDPTPYALGGPVGALAAGPDGALWAAVPGGVARIVPGTAPTVIRDGLDPAARGLALAAGPDGRMWMTLDRAPYLVAVTGPPATPDPDPEPEPTASPSPDPQPVPTTAPAPPPTTPPPAQAPTTPAPAGAAEGKSVEVAVTRGTVEYRVPPSTDYVRLIGRATLPLGVVLDTESGQVALTSQVDGALQTGRFNGGKFSVTQTATGMTELALAGPLTCTRSERASAAQKGKRKKKKRGLWGSDRGGSFRTRGNGSVATVRGTVWRTEDTCAGTRVTVLEGAVSVWPRRGGKSVLLRAGQRLFTPRPR